MCWSSVACERVGLFVVHACYHHYAFHFIVWYVRECVRYCCFALACFCFPPFPDFELIKSKNSTGIQIQEKGSRLCMRSACEVICLIRELVSYELAVAGRAQSGAPVARGIG